MFDIEYIVFGFWINFGSEYCLEGRGIEIEDRIRKSVDSWGRICFKVIRDVCSVFGRSFVGFGGWMSFCWDKICWIVIYFRVLYLFLN